MDKKVLEKLCRGYAKYHEENMREFLGYAFLEQKITSPIEQVFFAAFSILVELGNLSVEHSIGSDDKLRITGVGIYPQVQFDQYRVDFVCSYSDIWENSNTSVIVECDSQAFHERTEPERRYEKKRDRFLQKSGHKVFRFTGRELLDDPLAAASEVIEHLIGRKLGVILNG